MSLVIGADPVDVGGFIVVILVLVVGFAWFTFVTLPAKRAQDEKNKIIFRAEELRQSAVLLKYEALYLERVTHIGEIKCLQCSWTGTWGDRISYIEMFSFNIHAEGVDDVHLTNIGRDGKGQYKCPICQSTGWEQTGDLSHETAKLQDRVDQHIETSTKVIGAVDPEQTIGSRPEVVSLSGSSTKPTTQKNEDWRYKMMGEELGPVSTEELQKLIANGSIDPFTHIRRDGQEEWKSALDYPEFTLD